MALPDATPVAQPARIVAAVRRRSAAMRKGRSVGQLAGDVVTLVRQQGVRGAMFRATYEATRALAPPSTEIVVERPIWGPGNPPLNVNAFGTAGHPFCNVNCEELAANRHIVERFDHRPRVVRTATWFVPYFQHVYFGGIHTALRLMDWMKREHGVDNRIVFYDDPPISEATLRARIAEAFPSLLDVDLVLPPKGVGGPTVIMDELPPSDIAFCTLWYSAFPLARFNATKAKFYLVQDYEPAFYAAGTLNGMAEATYRFGFAGIVNTPGLEAAYAAYGNPTVSFVPAVDSAEPLQPARQDGPVRIVIYGRPSIERNGFELLAAAAHRLKDRFGNRIEIVSAGENWDPAGYGLSGVVENLGLLPSKHEVHELYKTCDIGLCFMFSKHPSYQPFEYFAAGAAVVTNANLATTWLLRDGENCLLTEAIADAIADTVSRLVTDPELRAKLAAAGWEAVRGTRWDDEFSKVWRFVTGAED